MFSDPQFWVAVSFFLFLIAIFNPVRKILTSNLDTQINEIKSKIHEAENLKKEAEKTLTDLKNRQSDVEKEIQKLKNESEEKIIELKKLSSNKLSEQIKKREILAENKIQLLLRDANNIIKNSITNTAIEATTNIIKKNLTSQMKSDLINESIKDLNKVIKN